MNIYQPLGSAWMLRQVTCCAFRLDCRDPSHGPSPTRPKRGRWSQTNPAQKRGGWSTSSHHMWGIDGIDVYRSLMFYVAPRITKVSWFFDRYRKKNHMRIICHGVSFQAVKEVKFNSAGEDWTAVHKNILSSQHGFAQNSGNPIPLVYHHVRSQKSVSSLGWYIP